MLIPQHKSFPHCFTFFSLWSKVASKFFCHIPANASFLNPNTGNAANVAMFSYKIHSVIINLRVTVIQGWSLYLRITTTTLFGKMLSTFPHLYKDFMCFQNFLSWLMILRCNRNNNSNNILWVRNHIHSYLGVWLKLAAFNYWRGNKSTTTWLMISETVKTK